MLLLNHIITEKKHGMPIEFGKHCVVLQVRDNFCLWLNYKRTVYKKHIALRALISLPQLHNYTEFMAETEYSMKFVGKQCYNKNRKKYFSTFLKAIPEDEKINLRNFEQTAIIHYNKIKNKFVGQFNYI